MDYTVYLSHGDCFAAKSFEEYCAALGLHTELHPDFSLQNASGFVPVRLQDIRLADRDGNSDFLSGFECYVSEYSYAPPDCPRKRFFHMLQRKKEKQENPFEKAIQACTLQVDISCLGDPVEVLLAYLMGAYFAKYCGGVFDDPQTGQFFTEHAQLEAEVSEMLEELIRQRNTGTLVTHPFSHWN